MNHPARFTSKDFAPSRLRGRAARRRLKGLLPTIEGLEDRVVLSTIQWNSTAAPQGGAWDTPGNWVGGVMPGSGDNAVIDLTSTGTVTTGPSDTALSLTTNASTTVSVSNGKLTLGAATSTIGGPLTVTGSGILALSGSTLIGAGTVTDAGQLMGNFSLGLSSTTMSSGSSLTVNGVAVQPGATLTVASNSSVTVTDSQWLSVSGQVNVTGASVAIDKNAGCCGTSDGIVVNQGGTMTVSDSSFYRNGGSGYENSYLQVSTGGRLIASGTTFSLDNLYLNPGLVLDSGDLTGNVFNSPLYAPIADEPLLTNNQSFDAVYLTGGLAGGQSVTLDPIGTQTTSSQSYILPSGLGIAAGQSLTIENGATVTIADSQWISVGGQLDVTGASVVFDKNAGCCGTSDGIMVDDGGTMTASGSSFSRNGGSGYENSYVEVTNGGHLIASGSTFSLDNLYLDAGSVLDSGDLSNNIFNAAFTTPVIDVPLLANNESFDAVYLTGGLASGQSVTLVPLGTQTTANQYYVLDNGLTVASGATLMIGTDASVTIADSQWISVGGQLDVAGASVVFDKNAGCCGTSDGIMVDDGGTMTASDSSFYRNGGSGYENSYVSVSTGGHLIASGSTFSLDNLYLDAGSVLDSGDLTGNVFNATLTAPITDLPLLTGNQSFVGVYLTGSVLGSSLALTPIGTQTTAGQYYVLSNGLTVASGATLTIGTATSVTIASSLGVSSGATVLIDTGASVTIADSQWISVSGQLDVTGASVVFDKNAGCCGTSDGIVVNQGGTMTVGDSSFSRSGGSGYENSYLQVSAGGHLTASGSAFSLDNIYLNAGLILNQGDLTGNVFGATLTTPVAEVPLLANNESFGAVYLTGGVASGQSVALVPLGTLSTANQYYVLANGLSVSSGGTLTIGTGASVTIADSQWLYVSGQLNVIGASVAIDKNAGCCGTADGIVVNNGGTMTVSDSSFSRNGGSGYENSYVSVSTGGQLTASTSYFGLDNFYLNSGSSDQMTVDVLTTQLQVNSGASISVTDNDFSNSTVVASGDPTATINLGGNYWGTTTPSQIAAKITDHADNSNLPTVSYASPLSVMPAPGTATGDTAASVSASYSGAGQSVALSAAITSTTGTVGQGSVTFTLVNGANIFGTPVTVGVSGGSAKATYPLPAGTPSGIYTIQSVYFGTASLFGSIDTAHVLTVNPAASTNAGASATAVFNTVNPITLTAKVTSPAGTVNVGTETFSILSGTTLIGSPVTAAVAGGAASATFSLPTGTPTGIYTIEAVYSSPIDFVSSTDSSHTLTITSAATTTAASGTSAAFSMSTQSVNLGAAVTSLAGVVNTGSVTFTILSGSTIIGTPVAADVANSSATASYSLPAGTATGTYTIKAVYTSTADFLGSSDSSHTLAISGAASTTAGANASATYNTVAQNVALTATITSPAGTVNAGTETFTILNNTATVGTPVTVNVVNGAATATYSLPAATVAGGYIIKAVYNGGADFSGSSDASHALVVAAAATTTSTTSLTATYNAAAAQTLALKANVTSPDGAVGQGTETFTVLGGSTVIGNPVTANVSGGAASTNYSLPAGTAAGNYTIQDTYNGTANFLGSTDSGQSLTVGAATATVAAANASSPYSAAAQSVVLTAAVTSGTTKLGAGTVSFTILNGTNTVGTDVISNVVGGSASATYTLPAGTASGVYIIQAVYSGVPDYSGYTDTSHELTVGGAATTTAATNASAVYDGADQAVALEATVTSAAGTVGQGTETFTILSGSTAIGNPVTVNVSGGSASANYSLPGGTVDGKYTIQAVYSGGVSLVGSSDSSHSLTVGVASTTTAATNASVTYNAAAQPIALGATVTSAAGTVNQGTETFTILNNTATVGTPVTVNVVNGAATATYSLPAATAAGGYIIKAVYNGASNFSGSTDSSHALTVGAASTATAAANVSATFNGSAAQTIALTATITSPAGAVASGTETFTILNGSTVVGNPVTVNVANGAGAANSSVPAGTAAGTYTIKVAYQGTTNLLASSDTSHTLTIDAATATVAAANAATTESVGAQSVILTASVSSGTTKVGEGSVTFTVLSGTTAVGTAVQANVVGGSATATYTLPAGTAAGTYVIQAVYSGTANYTGFTDSAHDLTVSAPATTDVASAAAIAATTPASTGGGATAPVPQIASAALPGTTVDVAGHSSASDKVHRKSGKINRGPLSLGRAAARTHTRTGHQLPVTDRRSQPDARPGHRG